MFATGALGPVHYAGQCILARRAEEGLKELSVDNLRGGVARGILQAAQRVGVPASEIQRLLPMAELDQIMLRIAASQPKVLEAWRLYAGGLGGLLTGVADLTVDGRAPDTALCVQRLAKKVQRDRPFSEPLEALANDLFDWQDALHRCVDLLNDTTALEKAYRRRRSKRIAGIAAGSLVVALLLSIAAWRQVVRSRVVAVLEKPDVCAVMDLSESDIDRVSSDLRERARASRAKCEAERAAEQKRKEDEEARLQREAAEKKAKEEQEARCDALAEHVAAGKLEEEDAVLAKEAAGLLGRVAKGALELGDYGPAEPPLPCKGTKAEAALSAAFRKAVLAKPWNIPKVESPSAAVREAIAQGSSELPPKLKMMTGKGAADAAQKAITSGKPEHIARAIAMCETAKVMGTAPAGPCEGVKSLGPK
jgi:hypothetical protein